MIRYKLFNTALLLLELVNAISSTNSTGANTSNSVSSNKSKGKTHAEQIELASPKLSALFEQVKSFLLAQDDDFQKKSLKHYTAFKRLKNFVCLAIIPKQDPQIRLWLKLNPDNVELQEGYSRDVRKVGHWGTGDLEIVIRTQKDFEKELPLIERSYQEN